MERTAYHADTLNIKISQTDGELTIPHSTMLNNLTVDLFNNLDAESAGSVLTSIVKAINDHPVPDVITALAVATAHALYDAATKPEAAPPLDIVGAFMGVMLFSYTDLQDRTEGIDKRVTLN
jgi:hypothetical protein